MSLQGLTTPSGRPLGDLTGRRLAPRQSWLGGRQESVVVLAASPIRDPAVNAQLDQARQHFSRGIEHFEARRYAEARSCFQAALELAPGRASVLANLGTACFHLGRWDEAIATLEQATAAVPRDAEAWICLGLSHEARGHWQSAVNALERGLELDPGRAMAWLVCGQCRLRLGQETMALSDFEHALAIDPEFAQAWTARGTLLRELHRVDEAAECFEKARALGADPELHDYFLASVREGVAPPAPPRRYVEALFDDYAGGYEAHLLDQLRYEAHESLVRPLLNGGRRFRAVLDLGCGTGLCGALIHPMADLIDGVDVSAAMLEEARRLGLYRDLTHDDLVHYLETTGLRPDLVMAADVFIYVGELAPVFRSVRRILKPEGRFAFTVELAPAGQDVRLLPSLRYAHSEAYIRRLAQTHDFKVRDLFVGTLRRDQGRPVPGLYVYLE